MMFQKNPLGVMVNNYLMRAALPLAVWFIAEYMIRNAASTNLLLSMVMVPLMLVTPIVIWRLLKKLRDELLGGYMLGIQAWMFGVQIAFFAGLIEALYIYVFNEWVRPGNIAAVQQATVDFYASMLDQLKETGAYTSWWSDFESTLTQLKEMPVPSAIETAISSLSNEIMMAMFYMIPLALFLRRKPKMN